MHYRKDIDGLRALSIVFVIVFHAFPKLLPNGFLGVDIFFVISGFLITSIILHNLNQNKFSFVNFYIRRIKRIFPIAFLVLFVVAGVGAVTLFSTEFNSLKTYLRSAAGFYINFQLLKDAGYFDVKSTYKPLLHYWSLAIEEQFYLVWPLILFLNYKVGAFWVKKSVCKILNFLIVVCILLLVPSLIYFLIQPTDQYFSSFIRAWELLVGCLAAVSYLRINFSDLAKEKLLRLSPLLSVLGIVSIFISQIIFDERISTVLAVLGAALYLISEDEVSIKSAFKAKPIVFIGLISYSLYLWHWPFLSFYRTYKPSANPFEIIVLISLAVMFSILTYYFIEAPLKNQNWDLKYRNLSPKQFQKIGFKLFFCLGVALFIFNLGGSPRFQKLPDKIVNKLDFVEDDALGLNPACLFNEEDKKKYNLAWCFTDSSIKEHKGFVFGDSHAHSVYKGLVSIKSDINWQLVANYNCSPFVLKEIYSDCAVAEKMVTDFLKSKNEIEYVLYVMSNRIYKEQFMDRGGKFLQEDIIKDLNDFAKSGKKIIVLTPIPEIADNIYSCVAQRFSFYKVFDSESICKIDRNQWAEDSRDYYRFLNLLKEKVPNLVLIDSTSEICDDNYCYATRDGRALYEDKDHLSFHGSQLIAQKILEALKK